MVYQRVQAFLPQLLLTAALILTGIRLVPVFAGERQYDFRIYHAASVANVRGLDPYILSSLDVERDPGMLALPYLYPPFVLDLFRPFAALDLRQAYYVFLILKLIAVVALIRIWLKHLQLSKQQVILFLITLLLGYRRALYLDVSAGNVSTFEQLLLWWGIVTAIRGHLLRGDVFIAASAMFKLATLALTPLIIVIVRGKRAYVILAMVIAACAAFLSWNVSVKPDQWHSFTTVARSLDERGKYCPSIMAQIRDLVDAFALPQIAVTVVYGVWVLLVLSTLIWAYRRTRVMENVIPMVYVTIIAYAIIVPRMKDYSYILLLVPTFHVLMSTVKNRWVLALLFIAFWVAIADYQQLWLAIATFALLIRWIATKADLRTATLQCSGQLPDFGSLDRRRTVSHLRSQ